VFDALPLSVCGGLCAKNDHGIPLCEGAENILTRNLYLQRSGKYRGKRLSVSQMAGFVTVICPLLLLSRKWVQQSSPRAMPYDIVPYEKEL
jgi:hypothetical protein